MIRRHHYHSPWRRAGWSVGLVVGALALGTIGIHGLAHLSWVNALYFTSMLVTAQGPAAAPQTTAWKMFAAVMAFVGVGCVTVSLGFLFGPVFGKLWRVGVEHFEEEMRRLRGGS